MSEAQTITVEPLEPLSQSSKRQPTKMGRPPKADIDDPNVIALICARLVAGESIIEIGASPDMPAATTIYLKMAQDRDFRSIIGHAREAQQEAEADRMVQIADEANADNWQVKRLQIWARQWRASKLAPKKYGDQQQQTITIVSDPAEAQRKSEQAERLIAVLQELADKKARGEPIPKLIEGEVKKPQALKSVNDTFCPACKSVK